MTSAPRLRFRQKVALLIHDHHRTAGLRDRLRQQRELIIGETAINFSMFFLALSLLHFHHAVSAIQTRRAHGDSPAQN